MTRAHFQLPVRVYYEDTDVGGVVYYANYLKFLERARTEWLRGLGFEQTRLAAEHRTVFAVREAHIHYLRPARLDDALIAEARVAHVKRAQVSFAQRVLRGDEELVTATVRVACLDSVSFTPRAVPDVIRHALESLLE